LRRERRKAGRISPRPPELEGEVPSLHVTELSEAEPERFDTRVPRGVGAGSEESDAPDSDRLLRPGGERRGEEAARDGPHKGTSGHVGRADRARLVPPTRHRCGVSFRCRRSVADYVRRRARALSITRPDGLAAGRSESPSAPLG